MDSLAATSTTLALTPQAPSDKDKLKGVAKQFEAIFVRQMLAEARKAKPAGEDTLFGGQAMDTFNQMQDEKIAQIAADKGALGLARSLETQLAAAAGLGGDNAATAPAAGEK
jgi:flagellar protein FlgJ